MALTSLMSFELSLLKALNNNAAAIQAITTMVLVGVTAWYVYLTRQMLQAARTSQRPYVYIDVSGEGGLAWENFADLDSVLITSFQTSSDKMAGSLREIAQLMLRRDSRDTPWREGPPMKACPICGETIRATATKCPRCREWLLEERLENDATESGPGSTG